MVNGIGQHSYLYLNAQVSQIQVKKITKLKIVFVINVRAHYSSYRIYTSFSYFHGPISKQIIYMHI